MSSTAGHLLPQHLHHVLHAHLQLAGQHIHLQSRDAGQFVLLPAAACLAGLAQRPGAADHPRPVRHLSQRVPAPLQQHRLLLGHLGHETILPICSAGTWMPNTVTFDSVAPPEVCRKIDSPACSTFWLDVQVTWAMICVPDPTATAAPMIAPFADSPRYATSVSAADTFAVIIFRFHEYP